jgi:TonB family protein
MAHFPMPQPDPEAKDQAVSGSGRLTEIPGSRRSEAPTFESDLAELAAKFSSEEGGSLSAELSADLALEVVLNEIVEQACVATGASGAAVILERSGEWVCRATSGPSAPQLGERLGREAGLIAECIRTRQIQRCKNSETDTRAETGMYRNLGVRSVIVLPLFENGNLVGVFAAFSAQAFDFRTPEERTFEALCGYVLSSLAQAAEPIQVIEAAAIKQEPSEVPEHETKGSLSGSIAGSGNGLKVSEKIIDEATATNGGKPGPAAVASGENRTLNIATWVLAAVVLAAAALLTTVATERLIGKKAPIRADQRHAAGINPTGSAAAELSTNDEGNPARAIAAEAPAALNAANSHGSSHTGREAAERRQETSPEDGSLTVYEDGKEVFHLPPGAGVSAPQPQTQRGSVRDAETARTPAVEPVNTTASNGPEGGVILRIEPEYPEQALEQKIEGAVVLDLWVGRDGTVQQVKVVNGAPVLAGAAVAAVKQWQFNPHLINGKPAEMRSRVTLNFTLPY